MPDDLVHTDQQEPARVSADINLRQQTEELTGIPKVDAWIKVVKYLGFPVAVASAGLWILYLVLGDYRASIKANTESSRITADAVISIDKTNVKNALYQESNAKAMWSLNQKFDTFIANQHESLSNQRDQIKATEKIPEVIEKKGM